MRHRQTHLVVGSRRVRVAGIARTDRVCSAGRGAVRFPGVQASLGIDRRRDPVHGAIAAELASLAHWEVAGPARHGFKPSRPSVGSAPKDEGENPRAVTQITTQPPGRWDNAGRSTAPAPQSKPVTVAYRLVAQRCAIGGNWASAENPGRRASVFDSTPIAGVYVNQTSKGLLRLVRGRGHRLISRQRPGPSSTELAHPRERSLPRPDDETRATATRLPSGEDPQNIRSTSARTCTSPTSQAV